MFEQSLIPEEPSRKPWTVMLAMILQVIALGVVILIPMLYVQSLPVAVPTQIVSISLPPPPPSSPPPEAARAQAAKIVPRKFDAKGLFMPVRIPKQLPIIAEPTVLAESGVAGGVPGAPGGLVGGVPGGVLSALPKLPPPPPAKPSAPAEPASPQRINVGGKVEAALLTHEVEPHYPLLARQARISGTVVLKAVIGRDGSVEDLSFVSGHPLLADAAMAAVKHWRYEPVYLNGKPVEVSTEIDVHFTLAS